MKWIVKINVTFNECPHFIIYFNIYNMDQHYISTYNNNFLYLNISYCVPHGLLGSLTVLQKLKAQIARLIFLAPLYRFINLFLKPFSYNKSSSFFFGYLGQLSFKIIILLNQLYILRILYQRLRGTGELYFLLIARK